MDDSGFDNRPDHAEDLFGDDEELRELRRRLREAQKQLRGFSGGLWA